MTRCSSGLGCLRVWVCGEEIDGNLLLSFPVNTILTLKYTVHQLEKHNRNKK